MRGEDMGPEIGLTSIARTKLEKRQGIPCLHLTP
jgi:hypothetical protein